MIDLIAALTTVLGTGLLTILGIYIIAVVWTIPGTPVLATIVGTFVGILIILFGIYFFSIMIEDYPKDRK